MTALLTLEKAKLRDTFTAANYNARCRSSRRSASSRGERMKVSDLMRGLLLESGNDAAVTLAEGVSGSRKEFVRAMNRRARELELKNTHYANPIGLDQEGNYSSRARPRDARHGPAHERVLQEDRGLARRAR